MAICAAASMPAVRQVKATSAMARLRMPFLRFPRHRRLGPRSDGDDSPRTRSAPLQCVPPVRLEAGGPMPNPAVNGAGASIAEALDRREREGRPVRVGLVGAGQMGTDIIVQTSLMHGIEVVACADAIPENVFTACKVAVNPRRAPEMADGPGVASAIRRDRLAVCRSYRDVCTAEDVDVVIDATGNPNVGAQVALTTIAAGKHMVMMNVEADVTIGPYLCAQADAAGVVYTLGAGDEPSSTMELVNFVRGLGYPVVAAGKGKNNAFRIDATPDAYVEEAKRRNMNPRMLVEFVDGSKTMVEMVALANAT